MQKNSRSSSHVFDYVVIGAGLTGLSIAAALSRATSNVLLLESSESYGGLNRSVPTAMGSVNNGIRFLPDSKLSQKSVAFLESLLGTELHATSHEVAPVTFENGGLRPFVGFGENPPPFYEEINYFAQANSLNLEIEVHEISQKLFEKFTGEFMPRSYATRFHIDDGKVTQVTVNGQKTIQAHNFIYTGPVKSLKTLLPEELVTPRMLQKFSKESFWTAVCLDLLHDSSITDSTAMHILNGTTNDDIGPCAGRFKGNYSQWITFVEDQEAEDTEMIGAALKKIKRQIKRAYPDALENLKFERILVVPSYAGSGDLKINANQTLPGAENLWLASAPLNSQKNILGALLQAELITSSLGVNPGGMTVQTLPEEIPIETQI